MDNDDAQVGHVLTRREVLALFGAAGVMAIVGCADETTEVATASPAGTTAAGVAGATSTTSSAAQSTATGSAVAVAVPQCIVKPAQTEGPYFVDEGLNRSDIRSDPASGGLREGVPLNLTFNVSRVSGSACSALQGATVDVWQCDALGVYSDVQDNMAGNFNSVGQKFLRGFQVTDQAGAAKFVTIYPGWYQGRTVHIHFKIRARDAAGKAHEFTSQLYFDDALSDEVFTLAPYSQKGRRGTRNANDGIYRDGGAQLQLAPVRDGAGYSATFPVGLQLA